MPSLKSGGAEVGHVYWRAVHLDGDVAAIAKDHAVDRGNPSRVERDAGHGHPEPSAHVLA